MSKTRDIASAAPAPSTVSAAVATALATKQTLASTSEPTP